MTEYLIVNVVCLVDEQPLPLRAVYLGSIVHREEFQLGTIVISPHIVSRIPMWISLERMTNDVFKVTDCTFLEMRE